MTRVFLFIWTGLLVAVLTCNDLTAQSGSTQQSASTPTPTTATTQAAAAPASGTYSIEAEMFAYRSLASNSDQIASEVGSLIPASTPNGEHPPAPRPGVVIVPSVSTILPAFQAWRSNMLVIQNFLNQAAKLPSSAASGCPSQAHIAEAPSFAAYATGVSQAVGVIQSIIGLFANNESITEYPGTIQDQALISGVARRLRGSQLLVLAPDLFAPWTIDVATAPDSQFIGKLGELIDALMRLQDLYQCSQITLNAASQLQQAETTRAADFAKLTDSSLTASNRTALIFEIRSMKAQIDYFRQKLGLDIVGDERISGPENDTMNTEMPILSNASSTDAQKTVALANIRRNDAGVIGTFENPLVTVATLTAAKAQALVAGIQGYLSGLTGGAVSLPTPAPVSPATSTPPPAAGAPAAPGAAPGAAASPSPGASTPQTPTGAPSPTASSPASATPPILSILQADGLARRMNVRADERNGWDFNSWRILWVKSMESGGAIIMHSNIFGAHPRFSGGAISGYALFQLDGTLVCSGNVGAYGGYVDPKHFLGSGSAVQMIPLGPGCDGGNNGGPTKPAATR